METQTINANLILAEFMGYEPFKNRYNRVTHWKQKNPEEYYLGTWEAEEPPSFSNWNLVMPVIEKIRDIERMGTIQNTISFIMSKDGKKRFNSVQDLKESAINYIQSATL